MVRFLSTRLLSTAAVLMGLVLLSFLLVYFSSSDPTSVLAGENATAAQVAALRHQSGLDQPLPQQLAVYIGKLARLDLGVSAFSQRPIADELAERLPATLELVTTALLVAVAAGVPLGVMSALSRGRAWDFPLRLATVSGVAVPSFWLAIILQLLFAMGLGWLPLRGELSDQFFPPDPRTGLLPLDCLLAGDVSAFGDALAHLALPAATLAIGGIASLARFTRAGVLDALQQDYVLYEHAMGFSRRRIVWLYVLRNGLTGTITQGGLLFGSLLAGGVVVESVFDWPGVGSYAVQAIITGDRQAVLAATLLIGVIYTLVNLAVDGVHAIVDPRVRGA